MATMASAYALVYVAALARRTYRYAEVFGSQVIFMELALCVVPLLGWRVVVRPRAWSSGLMLWLAVGIGILALEGVMIGEVYEDILARWHRGW